MSTRYISIANAYAIINANHCEEFQSADNNYFRIMERYKMFHK